MYFLVSSNLRRRPGTLEHTGSEKTSYFSTHQHIYLLLSNHDTDTIKTGLASHSNLQFANKLCIQNEEGNIIFKVQQIRITKTEILRHRLVITDDSLKKTQLICNKYIGS